MSCCTYNAIVTSLVGRNVIFIANEIGLYLSSMTSVKLFTALSHGHFYFFTFRPDLSLFLFLSISLSLFLFLMHFLQTRIHSTNANTLSNIEICFVLYAKILYLLHARSFTSNRILPITYTISLFCSILRLFSVYLIHYSVCYLLDLHM